MRPPKTRRSPARRAPRHEFQGERVERVIHLLSNMLARLECLEMASAEIKAILKRIDDATNNIAADIRGLKDGVKVGMSEAEVADVQALAEASAQRLEGIAADTADPVPDA